MSPKSILKRGFAIVKYKDKVIKDAESITPGSNLLITMADTEINTTVISKTQHDGSKFDV
jgi:exodeoxyribonuclease VII large subunit